MRKLAVKFERAADEVWRLHHRKGPDCDFFRLFCEKGHYGGRTEPTDTRQGLYCATPAGEFLASVNSTDPAAVAAMLERALAAWRKVPAKRRLRSPAPVADADLRWRGEARYPVNGLVLRVFSRDLPTLAKPPRRRKAERRGDWTTHAWNKDYAWFSAGEARSLVPDDPRPGQSQVVPAVLARRLARCHLVDNVRGQTQQFHEREIKQASLTTTVTGRAADRVEIALQGETRTDGRGAQGSRRGIHTRLAGTATYDLQQKRFVRLQLVAIGTRKGRTRYNFRREGEESGPIGFAFELAPDEPVERVAPALLWSYQRD